MDISDGANRPFDVPNNATEFKLYHIFGILVELETSESKATEK